MGEPLDSTSLTIRQLSKTTSPRQNLVRENRAYLTTPEQLHQAFSRSACRKCFRHVTKRAHEHDYT